METVVQVLGMTFVGIIMICIGWTIVEYIINGFGDNNKLEENMKKFERMSKK
jgi:Na+-driven multidrug efflux pump